jgi:catechol 2,3-dioxygenase-like lactoylglutathione lyase family enzyme
MKLKFSRCFALQTPDVEKASAFYREIMGLDLVESTDENLELKAGQFRFFLDKGPAMGPIMEYVVKDLDVAREELLNAGCEIIRWSGKGKPCYMKDPFGLVFNVFEETETFSG